MKKLLVKDLMTSQLITLNSEEIVSEVYQIFTEHNIHHIPVIHADQKIVGIISKSDLDRISSGISLFTQRKKKELDAALYRSLRVLEIMTPQPDCIPPTLSVKEAIELFKTNKYRALPVVENEKIIGILTPYDVMTYCAENHLSS